MSVTSGASDDGEVESARDQASGRARSVLASAGLAADEPLSPVGGNWSNEVWIAPEVVLRISRRNPRWLAHEIAVAALLPNEIPYPKPIASGELDGDAWVIAPRIGGAPLYAAWAGADDPAMQARIINSLGSALRSLHGFELPPHLAHPPSVGGGPPIDPSTFPELVRAFLAKIVDLGVLPADTARHGLDLVERGEGQRAGGQMGTVHTDLTFANALWDGERVWLIDLEFCCTAPVDYDLTMLLSYCSYPPRAVPDEWAEQLSRTDHSQIPTLLAATYPELFDHPGLEARLALYGLASYARGWLIRPELWTSPELSPRSVELLTEFIRGDSWTRLIPR